VSRHDVTCDELLEAMTVADKAGLALLVISSVSSPPAECVDVKVVHYRIEGLGGSWFKEIYPDLQRISCPDKDKQGPFISMQIGRTWSLLDVVKACVAETARQVKKQATGTAGSITVHITPSNNRATLVAFVKALAQAKGATPEMVLESMAYHSGFTWAELTRC